MDNKKYFYACLAVIVVYIFPILTTTIYYKDDLARVMYGHYGWLGDARPLTEIGYKILSFNSVLPDLFPLPLILSVVFISYVFTTLSNSTSHDNRLLFILCSVTVLLNPLFVENLHFRYDAPFMVLSLGFALLPFCYSKLNQWYSFAIGSCFLILSISAYQSAINVYIAFTSLEILRNSINNNYYVVIKKAASRLSALIVALLIYKFLIVPSINTSQYFNIYNNIIPLGPNFINSIIKNISTSFLIFKYTLNAGFLLLILSIILASVIPLLFITKGKNYKDRIRIIIFYVLFIFSMLFCISGVVVFAETPIYFSRVYVGFGAVIACMLMPTCWLRYNNKTKLIKFSFLVIPYIYLFSFSYAANNAMKIENAHMEDVARMIVSDIRTSGNENIKNLVVSGKLKKSKQAEIAITAFPMIAGFLPQTFDGGYRGGEYLLNRLGLPDIRYDYDEIKPVSDCLQISSGYYYNICKKNNELLSITFN